MIIICELQECHNWQMQAAVFDLYELLVKMSPILHFYSLLVDES